MERKEIKALFSAERFKSFRADVRAITKRQGRKHNWTYFFQDHGYNPPPPWTLVGGTLSGLTPVEHLRNIAAMDMMNGIAQPLVGCLIMPIGTKLKILIHRFRDHAKMKLFR